MRISKDYGCGSRRQATAAARTRLSTKNKYSGSFTVEWDFIRLNDQHSTFSVYLRRGGYGDGRFGPNGAVTIEQVAIILWNYSDNPSFTGTPDGVGKYDDWAKNALSWAVENGIMKDVPLENATDNATRAQTAQMLMNYLSK